MASSSGRRSWSREQKRRIMEETFVPGVSVAEVARRHELNANLLFKWLRQAGHGRRGSERGELVASEPGGASEFVPLGVLSCDADTGGAVLRPPTAEVPAGPATAAPASTMPEREERVGMIEIDLPGGARLRVDAFVDQAALRRVLLVMKGLS